ncbi:MAG: cytochrome P450, partial [Myxococcota bacterium]
MNISPLSYASKLLRAAVPDGPDDPNRPPLVDGAQLYGHMRRLQADPLRMMLEVGRMYRPVARLQLGPITAHLVTSPELARDVLLTRRELFSKDTRGFRKLRVLLGDGLLTSEGTQWRRQRRTMQPVFRRSKVSVFADAMVRQTTQMLDAWEEDADRNRRPLDVAEAMMGLTLRIVGETLLGADFSGEINKVSEAVDELMEAAILRIRMPLDWTENLPLPVNAR